MQFGPTRLNEVSALWQRGEKTSRNHINSCSTTSSNKRHAETHTAPFIIRGKREKSTGIGRQLAATKRRAKTKVVAAALVLI